MNVKEIGKELMGKSLNSYHRRTGLTQLEENNKMQDRILDGILSQVDDAYIEKTEQSNVIHLEGSGDGVVVLDSIEGNTMVNLANSDLATDTILEPTTDSGRNKKIVEMPLNSSSNYTLIVNVKECNMSNTTYGGAIKLRIHYNDSTEYPVLVKDTEQKVGIYKHLISTKNGINKIEIYVDGVAEGRAMISELMLLEGNWTNKETPPYFKGLQSSFKEHKEEDKYKIEILSQNRGNLLYNNQTTQNYYYDAPWTNGYTTIKRTPSDNARMSQRIKVLPNTQYSYSCKNQNRFMVNFFKDETDELPYNGVNTQSSKIFTTDSECNYIEIYFGNAVTVSELTLNLGNGVSYNNSPKQNKIKLLLNEPLRSVHNVKDRLCIKDNKLVVERNVFGKSFDGTESIGLSKLTDSTINVFYGISATLAEGSLTSHMCDRLPNVGHTQWDKPIIGTHCKKTSVFFNIPLNWLGGNTINNVKQYLTNQYNQGTPMKIVHILNEPYYEEVLNEYGEPILLEGYENGTLYIDSTIVPTTTVRYTPKMESFKTLNEVSDNNTMLTNDINDNIIPYLMDVDLMIMEKEMALMSQYKVRKIGESDMTSMQKRTQDMLERLIKGKTLTEQECKTRVTTYLNAGKITDAQAEELMLLISEIYA